jgi:hypothetical protein
MEDVVQIRGDLPFQQVRRDHSVVVPPSLAFAIRPVGNLGIALAPELDREPTVDVEPKLLSRQMVLPERGTLA